MNRLFHVLCLAWMSSTTTCFTVSTSRLPSLPSATRLAGHDPQQAAVDRRGWLSAALAATTTVLLPSPSRAESSDIMWITGKEPLRPGQKPRDKKDVSGTRKDPNFLRSLADCKNQCENATGPDGLAKSKEDCLSDCQDVCCKTYQQCTFGIVPRI